MLNTKTVEKYLSTFAKNHPALYLIFDLIFVLTVAGLWKLLLVNTLNFSETSYLVFMMILLMSRKRPVKNQEDNQ